MKRFWKWWKSYGGDEGSLMATVFAACLWLFVTGLGVVLGVQQSDYVFVVVFVSLTGFTVWRIAKEVKEWP